MASGPSLANMVWATQDAGDAIKCMERILRCGSLDQLGVVIQAGDVLASEQHWQAPQADAFRTDWSQLRESLLDVQRAASPLRVQADRIFGEIVHCDTY